MRERTADRSERSRAFSLLVSSADLLYGERGGPRTSVNRYGEWDAENLDPMLCTPRRMRRA